jgi:hypothetical protein
MTEEFGVTETEKNGQTELNHKDTKDTKCAKQFEPQRTPKTQRKAEVYMYSCILLATFAFFAVNPFVRSFKSRLAREKI